MSFLTFGFILVTDFEFLNGLIKSLRKNQEVKRKKFTRKMKSKEYYRKPSGKILNKKAGTFTKTRWLQKTTRVFLHKMSNKHTRQIAGK